MKAVNSITGYFQGILTEMKKVTWPSFPQLFKYLMSVIVGVILATSFIGGIDFLFINYFLPLFIKK